MGGLQVGVSVVGHGILDRYKENAPHLRPFPYYTIYMSFHVFQVQCIYLFPHGDYGSK